jgi:hypothetical protein
MPYTHTLRVKVTLLPALILLLIPVLFSPCILLLLWGVGEWGEWGVWVGVGWEWGVGVGVGCVGGVGCKQLK